MKDPFGPDYREVEFDPAVDLLAGYPDMTCGRAEDYFRRQTPEDRAIIHDYEANGWVPFTVWYYVEELVNGYHLRDPVRISSAAIEMVEAEIGRAERFVDLFLEEPSFFPWLRNKLVTDYDSETGESYVHPQEVWMSNMRGLPGIFFSEIDIDAVPRFFKAARGFLQDPTLEAEYRAAKNDISRDSEVVSDDEHGVAVGQEGILLPNRVIIAVFQAIPFSEAGGQHQDG